MRAVQVAELGEPETVMRLADVEVPAPDEGQLLVKVRAAGVNFPDALLARGQYQVKPPLPFVGGIELCGDVVSVGPGVHGHRDGVRVLGSAAMPHGAFAEYALMPATSAFPAPEELDDAEAAAMFVGYQTGWFGLHTRAHLQPGETLLVHAAAGGVGSAAVQLGKAAGARVIGVAGGGQKCELVRELGADLAIDRRSENFIDVVKEYTAGAGADVVYDPVGGEAYAGSTKCIAFEGRIIIVGFASGEIPTAALNHALIKNYSILGLHWGLYAERRPGAQGQAQQELNKLATAGLVKPLVSQRLSMAELPGGVAQVAAGTTTGRITMVAP